MSTLNKVYNVTGRYMSGTEVVGYHLVCSDGTSMEVGKEKAILMTSRGLIENIRVQYGTDNSVIIRGKGVNLNNLPIYDVNKSGFRQNNQPEISNINKKCNNPLNQYKLIKRIMYKTSCVGYVLIDNSGKEIKINRSKMLEIAMNGLVVNAEARKYIPSGKSEAVMTIRGIGVDIKNLPTVFVDPNGNIIDTTKENQKVNLRATQLKRSGILYNSSDNTTLTFSAGDYLIVSITGNFVIIPKDKIGDKIIKSASSGAMCDDYLSNVDKYSIEFLGYNKNKISSTMILKWPVVTMVK